MRKEEINSRMENQKRKIISEDHKACCAKTTKAYRKA